MFWGLICMHTTKLFRISQPAGSLLKAQAQRAAQGKTRDISSKLHYYPWTYLEKVKCISCCQRQGICLDSSRNIQIRGNQFSKIESNKHPKWTNLWLWNRLLHLLQSSLENFLCEWDFASSKESLHYSISGKRTEILVSPPFTNQQYQ